MKKESHIFANYSQKISTFILIVTLFICFSAQAQERSKPLIIDHTCNDLSQITNDWIEKVKKNIKVFHASTSHGMQLLEGLLRLENQDSKYSVAYDWTLPKDANTLCILHQSWYEPETFFSNIQTYLNANPEINVAMYVWCGQATWYDINKYTSEMVKLELANPKVTFIYVTGNAQEADNAGYGRHQFNQALRQYCSDHKKVLYDFGDLDVWYGNEYTPKIYNWDCWGTKPMIMGIPLEHPQWNGNESSHTTYASCENKGRAVWWMLARIAGWENMTPVELALFQANLKNNSVQLTWQTSSEKSNYGFEVQRSLDKNEFQKLGFIQGHGTSNIQQNYEYIDQTVQPGKYYYYRLKQIDMDGFFEYSPVIEINMGVPNQYNLEQNYPNPFNPSTEICYELPDAARVQLSIFNISGSEIMNLANEYQTAGRKVAEWDGKDKNGTNVSSGLYLYRLIIDGSIIAQKKMMLIR